MRGWMLGGLLAGCSFGERAEAVREDLREARADVREARDQVVDVAQAARESASEVRDGVREVRHEVAEVRAAVLGARAKTAVIRARLAALPVTADDRAALRAEADALASELHGLRGSLADAAEASKAFDADLDKASTLVREIQELTGLDTPEGRAKAAALRAELATLLDRLDGSLAR
jgi:chromosome segregation ATPase